VPAATAEAHPNIALCKYWGKRDASLNLPAVPSLSLTVAPYRARTTVRWDRPADRFVLNGEEQAGTPAEKVFRVLDLLDPWRPRAEVESENDFPTAAGLASSSAGFAALVTAACAAAGQSRTPEELSVLARRGSGSACRSVFGGWAEWRMGQRADGFDCHAIPLADEGHWDVSLVVAIFDAGPKATASTEGMRHCALTSPYHVDWVRTAPEDLGPIRSAVLDRDLARLAPVMERSALRMHAAMMGADPPLFYWKSGTVWAMDAVRALRAKGVPCAFTIDAGPNVKVLCRTADAPEVQARLGAVAERVEVLSPGPGARLVA
jgi:diphosphomevalonate decarboxylase